MKFRGVSLAEAIASIFILTAGSLACFTLLIQAFRYQAASEITTQGIVFAEQSLRAIRQWALIPANFDSDWSLYSDQLFSMADADFESRVKVGATLDIIPQVLDCARSVEVTVSHRSRKVVSVSGFIASPVREPRATDPLVVEALSPTTSLSTNASLEYAAVLYDVHDRAIPGVYFEFSQESVASPGPPAIDPGYGFIEQRSPNRAFLFHLLYGPTPPDPNILHDPGRLKVKALARYRGRDYNGEADELDLSL